MSTQLLSRTRIVLLVSAVVQTVFGLVMFLLPDLANVLLWSPPLQSVPPLAVRYEGALYLACAIGALIAFVQNNWSGARVYLSIGGPYVLPSLILTLFAAFTPPGVHLFSWLYIVLAALYVPIVAWVWVRQSRRQTS